MSDQVSEGLLSPFLRRRRLKAALPYLRGRVLDVGCGSGGLAQSVPAERYLGFDVDTESLDKARHDFPHHRFVSEMPHGDERFDTVAALAVIEHVPDAVAFLRELALQLAPDLEARIVCTTPHPAVEWIHTAGATIGLFSRHAKDEHEELLDAHRLDQVASGAHLSIVAYERFLLGANQLAVFRRMQSAP